MIGSQGQLQGSLVSIQIIKSKVSTTRLKPGLLPLATPQQINPLWCVMHFQAHSYTHISPQNRALQTPQVGRSIAGTTYTGNAECNCTTPAPFPIIRHNSFLQNFTISFSSKKCAMSLDPSWFEICLEVIPCSSSGLASTWRIFFSRDDQHPLLPPPALDGKVMDKICQN